MKQDYSALASENFDAIVIGAGIVGSAIAWDAALRGLRVALVEKGDFGGETSANSFKTVHGGLRYLQDGKLWLVRQMVRERRAFLHIAPELVQPMPCVLPTYRGSLSRGKPLLAAAVLVSDLLGFDRNRDLAPEQQLPGSRILSRGETLNLTPGVAEEELTGSILWYDAQMFNSERLLLSMVLAAEANGARVANYLAVKGFLRRKGEQRVSGVEVEDQLSGERFPIRGKLVINATGPWTNNILALLDKKISAPNFELVSAMSLVTTKLQDEYALGISNPSDSETKTLFVAPWRGYSLVGTHYAPTPDGPNEAPLSRKRIEGFIREVNIAYPGAELTFADVRHLHHGFLPAHQKWPLKVWRTDRVLDHEVEHGIPGLISAIGVKYTSALRLAEKTVDLVYDKLGQAMPPSQTHSTRLYGKQAANGHLQEILSEDVRHDLLHNYGTAYPGLFSYPDVDVSWYERIGPETTVIRGQVIHAVRSEMARTLADVVLRRTQLGSAGFPGEEAVTNTLETVARELGWSEAKQKEELAQLDAAFPLRQLS